MYNGIGLQTARGSGTNGYVQTNKFFVRPRNGGKPVSGGKGFADDQGTAGLSKKPNKDILEHDRKRQIHLKLAVLEDELSDQGFSDAEIAERLEEARLKFEAAAGAGGSEESDAKISDTQTHQVAARKEKQMEAFRAALGLADQEQAEEGMIEEEEPTGVVKERREHSFLDRGSGRKRDEDVEVKDGKVKESKKQRGDVDEVKRQKKKESKKRRHDDDSSESDGKGRDRRRRSKKKAKGRKQESDSESDSSSADSDSGSDSGEKMRRKPTKKRGRSRRSVSSESESEAESDDSLKLRESHKKSRPSNQTVSKDSRDKPDEGRSGRKRHDSDVSEPESEDEKQQLRKKEEAYRSGQKQKRDEEDLESNHLKDMRRGGKKAARDSDDSEAEYGNNKKQLRSKVEVYSGGMSKKRDEEETLPKHDKDTYRSDSRSKQVAGDSSDDSEAEYENRRKLKDDSYQRGRKQIREEDHGHHGRGDRYRSDDVGQRRGTVKDVDDRYRGQVSEEEDDSDRDRYRQRREVVRKDDEEYKRGRDRYRGYKEDRYRDDVAAGKRHVTGKEDEDDERVNREREYSNKGRSHYDGRSSEKRSSYGDRD